MKREFLLILGLSCAFILGLWAAIDFKNTQETLFTKSRTEKRSIQSQIKSLEDDLTFLKAHQKELDFLVEKGWFIPKSRLVAGEILEKRGGSLNDVQYTFEPESIKSLGDDHTFKVTNIVVEGGALFESDIYAFLNGLLDTFPGILRPHEFILSRGEEVNEKSLLALRQKERPNFVVGKLVLEWFVMGKKVHEN